MIKTIYIAVFWILAIFLWAEPLIGTYLKWNYQMKPVAKAVLMIGYISIGIYFDLI